MSNKTIEIFLISGKAENGKDTFASFMIDELVKLGKSREEIMVAKFGDVVKFAATQFFNWNGEKDEVGRGILQIVGTERGHQIIPGIWTKFISDMILMKSPEITTVLIPDWRFPEEYYDLVNYDHKNGYLGHKVRYYNSEPVEYKIHTVRVERPSHVSRLTAEQLKHVSETALDDFDFDFIIAADNIGELQEATIEFVKFNYGWC